MHCAENFKLKSSLERHRRASHLEGAQNVRHAALTGHLGSPYVHTHTHTYRCSPPAITIQHMSGTCILICCRAEAILMHMLQEAVQLQVPPGAPRDPDRMWWQPTSLSPLPGLGVMDINSSITFRTNFCILQLFGYHNNCWIIHNHEVVICHSPCQKFACVACRWMGTCSAARTTFVSVCVHMQDRWSIIRSTTANTATRNSMAPRCYRYTCAHTQVNFLSCL
jgi:hypothetical protein